MLRAAGRVFGFVVVELGVGDDLDDAERLVAHHRAGQFLAGDEGLDQHALAELPVRPRQFLRRMLVVLAHDEDADAGAFGHRLDHVRRRQQMFLAPLRGAITTMPPGTGTSAAFSTVLAMSFCMATAEAITPECV